MDQKKVDAIRKGQDSNASLNMDEEEIRKSKLYTSAHYDFEMAKEEARKS